MSFGTGLGIALGAGADAYRKQTAFDTDQQYQKMLMANQKNEIDSRNAVQQQIQALGDTGTTQYAQGVDANGNPTWGSKAPAAPNADPSSPAPPASIAAPQTAAPAAALPLGLSNNAPPSSIAAPTPAQPQASAMPSLGLPADTNTPVAGVAAGALPQTSLPATDQSVPQAPPTTPSRVYSAQQRMLDIADIYMKSGVPSLISAAGEIQNNALNTELTRQRIAAGRRDETNAQLDDNFKKSNVLLASGDTDAALTMAFSGLPGHTGLSVQTIPADGPVGNEGKVVAQVYGPDHQLRYSLPAASPQNLIDKMRYGLLDPEQSSKVQLQLAQGHAAEASANNLNADARKVNDYLDQGGTKADLDILTARTQEARAQSGLLSNESGRIAFSNQQQAIMNNPDIKPGSDQYERAKRGLMMAGGIFPSATVTVDPNTGQMRQTRNDVDPENSTLMWDQNMAQWVPPGTMGAAIAATPDWKNNQVTMGRDPNNNITKYRVAADGKTFDRFSDAEVHNQGLIATNKKTPDKKTPDKKVKSRTGDAIALSGGALPVRTGAADNWVRRGVDQIQAMPAPSGAVSRFGLPVN